MKCQSLYDLILYHSEVKICSSYHKSHPYVKYFCVFVPCCILLDDVADK